MAENPNGEQGQPWGTPLVGTSGTARPAETEPDLGPCHARQGALAMGLKRAQLCKGLLGKRWPEVVEGLAKVRLSKVPQADTEKVCCGMCNGTVLAATPSSFGWLGAMFQKRPVPST